MLSIFSYHLYLQLCLALLNFTEPQLIVSLRPTVLLFRFALTTLVALFSTTGTSCLQRERPLKTHSTEQQTDTVCGRQLKESEPVYIYILYTHFIYLMIQKGKRLWNCIA